MAEAQLKTPFRLLVTGSRTWDDENRMDYALKLVLLRIHEQSPEHFRGKPILISGCAQGADLMADAIWSGAGGDVEHHPADWDRYGKRAGYVRNAEMVATGANLCLAFIRANSRGATMCANLAEKAGIRTIRLTDARP